MRTIGGLVSRRGMDFLRWNASVAEMAKITDIKSRASDFAS